MLGLGWALAGRRIDRCPPLAQGRAEVPEDEQAQLEEEQNARISGLEQQSPAQPASAASSPMVDQLNQLAELHQQGVLTDEEFASAKAKLFSS